MGIYKDENFSEENKGKVLSFVGSSGESFYDENGNITSDGNRNIAYSSFDKAESITTKDKQATSVMKYGVNRELYSKDDCYTLEGVAVKTSTTYLGSYEKVERKHSSGETDLNFIEHKYYVGNDIVITQKSNGDSTHYLHKDHLGSVVSVSDESGNIITQAIYDPWGKRTEIYTASLLSDLKIAPPSDRGFTGHKHLEGLNIIHMKGRIYDPTLGRFMQADPHIQAPLNSQNYNRYSYVLNNPMSYTDPSGFFFKKLKKLVKKYWKVAAAAIATYATAGAASGWAASWGLTTTTTLGTIGAAGMTATVSMTTLSISGAVAAGAIAGAVGGATLGFLQTGSLKAAAQGALTGAIAGAAGGYANFGSVKGWTDAAQRVGIASLGGCGAGKASGGSCSKGARMAAMAQAVTMGAEAVYKKVSSKYNRTGDVHYEQEGISDVGKQVKEKLPDHYWGQSDQAGVMKDIAKQPYADAFAEFHDGLHDVFTDVLGKGDIVTNNAVGLIATMPHSYGVTLLAAARPYSHIYAPYRLIKE